MQPRGQGTMSATYSFSSQPRPVAGTRKYRDPGEDVSMFRDPKETSIMWDSRVHRGNTYGLYTQNAIKEALQDATSPMGGASPQASPPRPRRKSRPKEPKIFDMPLPERERVPVDLTKHLVAREEPVETSAVEAQTDEFLPEPPPEAYRPQKTGIDASTQVEEGDRLFVFDLEVEPILDVLVGKTLEQSLMEVEEEHELEGMQEFKEGWYQRQAASMESWQAEVEAERARWRQKEKLLEERREVKRREHRVLLKIQAMRIAKQHLAPLLPRCMSELQEVAFPDSQELAINQIFMPQLFGQALQEVQSMGRAQRAVDELLPPAARARLEQRSAGLAAHREKTRALEKRGFEEKQIRQGKIRIHVDFGSGEKVPVGPIQISSADDIETTQQRVYQWLQANEPKLAEAWRWGVVMLIQGEPVQATLEIFQAKAGQLSVVPKPEPPPPTPSEPTEEGEEGEEGGSTA